MGCRTMASPQATLKRQRHSISKVAATENADGQQSAAQCYSQGRMTQWVHDPRAHVIKGQKVTQVT